MNNFRHLKMVNSGSFKIFASGDNLAKNDVASCMFCNSFKVKCALQCVALKSLFSFSEKIICNCCNIFLRCFRNQMPDESHSKLRTRT